MDLRKPDGERYTATSLESIRHGLSRHLKSPPYHKFFDIVKHAELSDSNTNFKAMMAEV